MSVVTGDSLLSTVSGPFWGSPLAGRAARMGIATASSKAGTFMMAFMMAELMSQMLGRDERRMNIVLKNRLDSDSLHLAALLKTKRRTASSRAVAAASDMCQLEIGCAASDKNKPTRRWHW